MVDTYNFDERDIWAGRSGSPIETTHIDYDRRDIDFANEIGYYWPEENPFIAILMQVAKDTVGSTEFVWWDKDRPDWWTEMATDDDDGTGDYEGATNIIYLDEAHFINEKDLIKNVETGEVMYVKSIDREAGENDEDALTVERGVAEDTTANWGTGEVSADEGHEIIKLGNAMEENSLAPDTWAAQPKKRFNYVQTFRDPFDGSWDQSAEGVTAGPSERDRMRTEKLFEHRVNIERQVLFGERKEWIDTNNDVRRMTGGIIQFLEETSGTTVYDLGSTNNGVLTETEWRNFLSQGMKHGANTKLFLTSRAVAQRLDEHAAGRIKTTSEEETFGLKLNRYITTHGDVLISTTELFENYYGDMGLLLDIDNITLRALDGEDSTLKTNIQENDRDGWKDEYMTKMGLKLELAKTHAILEGVE